VVWPDRCDDAQDAQIFNHVEDRGNHAQRGSRDRNGAPLGHQQQAHDYVKTGIAGDKPEVGVLLDAHRFAVGAGESLNIASTSAMLRATSIASTGLEIPRTGREPFEKEGRPSRIAIIARLRTAR